MTTLNLAEHGAALHSGAATSLLPALHVALTGTAQGRPGIRLYGHYGRATLLGPTTPIGRIAAAQIGPDARPVRAVLFDKTPGENWALGWHQDRTIAVRVRHDVPGFNPWTREAGIQHVEPPFDIIEAMITLRVHLDAVPADNAPLLVAPGSHRLGRLPEPTLGDVVQRCGTAACLAEVGDIWCYATPIVHASARAKRPARRRVLQVGYAAGHLPPPLD